MVTTKIKAVNGEEYILEVSEYYFEILTEDGESILKFNTKDIQEAFKD